MCAFAACHPGEPLPWCCPCTQCQPSVNQKDETTPAATPGGQASKRLCFNARPCDHQYRYPALLPGDLSAPARVKKQGYSSRYPRPFQGRQLLPQHLRMVLCRLHAKGTGTKGQRSARALAAARSQAVGHFINNNEQQYGSHTQYMNSSGITHSYWLNTQPLPVYIRHVKTPGQTPRNDCVRLACGTSPLNSATAHSVAKLCHLAGPVVDVPTRPYPSLLLS